MTAHGKLHVCKSTAVDEKSGNSALVFQHLSFQSYHVIYQQELNTLKHRREHTRDLQQSGRQHQGRLRLKNKFLPLIRI